MGMEWILFRLARFSLNMKHANSKVKASIVDQVHLGAH